MMHDVAERLLCDPEQRGVDGFGQRPGAAVRDLRIADVDAAFGAELAHQCAAGGVDVGFMLLGENSNEVTKALRKQLELASKALPDDIKVTVVYDRTELVGKVIGTVEHNLIMGGIFVVTVLFVLLGNLRAGLLELRWEVVCPSCRTGSESVGRPKPIAMASMAARQSVL